MIRQISPELNLECKIDGMHNLEERRMPEEFNELNLATVVAEHKE